MLPNVCSTCDTLTSADDAISRPFCGSYYHLEVTEIALKHLMSFKVALPNAENN